MIFIALLPVQLALLVIFLLEGRMDMDVLLFCKGNPCAGFNASVFSNNDTCFTGLQLFTDVGPLLLLNVHMPTNSNAVKRVWRSMSMCVLIQMLLSSTVILAIS